MFPNAFWIIWKITLKFPEYILLVGIVALDEGDLETLSACRMAVAALPAAMQSSEEMNLFNKCLLARLDNEQLSVVQQDSYQALRKLITEKPFDEKHK